MKDKATLLLLGVIAVALTGMCLIARQKGSLLVATPGAELQLQSKLGRGVIVRSGSGPVAVPARAYQPTSLELTCWQGNDTWRLRSQGPWGKLARINVQRGRTTAIELGPPLQIVPQVAVYPGQVRISLGLFGRAGEKYENLIQKNNQRISEPHVRIIDEAGTTLASGRFQFG